METIRVSIGVEPMQWLPAKVLKSSILRRTDRRVEFTQSWTPQKGWHPSIVQAPRLEHGTRFSAWRWIVPARYGHEGRAIYLDADQVLLTDITWLWGSLEPEKMLGAVINATGIFGRKIPQPDKVQTSVMVMDCKKCAWCVDDIFKLDYHRLMQGAWLSRSHIQELSPAWNRFGVLEPKDENKLLHWSHVGSQPYRNPKHPTADVFRRELSDTLKAEHLTEAEVRQEVKRGHLDKSYLELL